MLGVGWEEGLAFVKTPPGDANMQPAWKAPTSLNPHRQGSRGPAVHLPQFPHSATASHAYEDVLGAEKWEDQTPRPWGPRLGPQEKLFSGTSH